ncbi:class F sortase [Pseudokineococcus lusitanus]|uniref:Sortase family protein n=1 Tax=Pseudokineococcus lusitanus TaxID=763993 RepID=A0A3N1GA03_9ACTN|nr:class F sortase [Pseudokineococcus lusitanus]ROP27070.1 sortase family protein [Pseudokineococcus lusitanus]
MPAAAVVLGLVAVGTPLAWAAATGPEDVAAVGAPLVTAPPAEALPAPPASASSPPPAAPAPVASSPATPTAVARDASPAAAAERQRRGPAPVEVRVPALGVVAPVDALGVDADGAMALPEDVARTSWYRYGAVPGSGRGTSVVAGHVSAADGSPGALADLPALGVDDVVEVVRADGSVLAYRVVTRTAVEKPALPVAELFADDGPERLVLVTCGGPYLRDVGAHRDNVVVVAEPA